MTHPKDIFPARDTLAWSLPPVWGLSSSGGHTPIIPRRTVRYDRVSIEAGVRFDVEGVSHVLAGPGYRVARLDAPEKAGSAFIFRNPGARDRVRMMGNPVYAADEREAGDALLRLRRDSLDRPVIEDPDRPLDPSASVSGRARITLDLPEAVDVATECPVGAYLVLSDTYDPGWSATIDGKAAPIRPAYVAFRSVYVPKGSHTLRFRYRPVGFVAGATVSALGLAVVLFCLIWPRRFRPLPGLDGDSGWPRPWPIYFGLTIAGLIVASSVAIGEGGRPALQARWAGSVHPFTWDSGIKAMKPEPPPRD